MQWTTTELDKVASVFNGKTPAKSEQRSEGHPVLKIRDVDEMGLFRGPFESFVDDDLAQKHGVKKVRAGDTLILNAAHNADYVASKTFRATPPSFGALATGEWLVVRPNDQLLDPGFANHWINSRQTRLRLRELVNGIHLYPKDVARLKISYPLLPEQRRIAAILDQAETLRTQRRTALALLDSLTQSLFLDMFGDPAINQKGWETKTIEELCEVKGGKRLPKGAEYSPTPTPHRYIRVTNLSNGQVDQSQLLYLTPEIQKSIGRYIVNTGDVIISIAGSIGLVAPVPASLDGVNLTENAAKLVQRRHGNYLPDFLAFMLGTKAIQDQIQSHVGQVTIGKLALFRIEKLTIPLPPLPLQQTFATRIAAIEALKTTHRQALDALDALFAALQQRAFAGQL